MINQLESRGQAQSIGGIEYLLQLAESSLSLGEVEAYAAVIRENAICRKLIQAGKDFIRQGLGRGREVGQGAARRS